jgi:hypothetical protein
MLLVFLGWPTLADVEHYLAPMYRYPPGVWVGVAATLLVIAAAHAKARQLRELGQFSADQGWQFSQNSSPIQDADWRQLSENSSLAALSAASARQNYTYGIHCGVQFVLFDAPGVDRTPHQSRGYETMIAFQKPALASSEAHLTVGQESAAWEKFLTDHWIFLRSKTPQWMVRGAAATRFVEEAYQQLQIL